MQKMSHKQSVLEKNVLLLEMSDGLPMFITDYVQ